MPLLRYKKYHLRIILGFLNKALYYMNRYYKNNELMLQEATDFHNYLLSILAKHKYKEVQYLQLYSFIRNGRDRYLKTCGTEVSRVGIKNYCQYINYFIYVRKEKNDKKQNNKRDI